MSYRPLTKLKLPLICLSIYSLVLRLVGHQKNSEPEPNYSGDFGDFFSFVHWMKKKAIEKDVDLLLIDSGGEYCIYPALYSLKAMSRDLRLCFCPFVFPLLDFQLNLLSSLSKDLHDGNGLSDGGVPLGETDGVQSSKIFAQVSSEARTRRSAHFFAHQLFFYFSAPLRRPRHRKPRAIHQECNP